ncbi:hypothetical protein C8J56DRAFT_1064244 [Mycena floridula]|nr:hypothetical protein C8J56DRAFT_1064244 [Mycena floridula]
MNYSVDWLYESSVDGFPRVIQEQGRQVTLPSSIAWAPSHGAHDKLHLFTNPFNLLVREAHMSVEQRHWRCLRHNVLLLVRPYPDRPPVIPVLTIMSRPFCFSELPSSLSCHCFLPCDGRPAPCSWAKMSCGDPSLRLKPLSVHGSDTTPNTQLLRLLIHFHLLSHLPATAQLHDKQEAIFPRISLTVDIPKTKDPSPRIRNILGSSIRRQHLPTSR